MDCPDYITTEPERKRGQHLGQEERGAIQHLNKQGYSLREIARAINCSPSTVMYELRRGTPVRKSNKGRAPEYNVSARSRCPKKALQKWPIGICSGKMSKGKSPNRQPPPTKDVVALRDSQKHLEFTTAEPIFARGNSVPILSRPG